MTRELNCHKVNGLNEALKIIVMDEPGPGGAHHDYAITFHDEKVGYERSPISERHGRNCIISFQKGPIAENGVNGISNESLLAIVEDRLLCFQNGPYGCEDNRIALEHVRDAIEALHKRTRERVARGVEGTSAK